jgi:hypothetical protein
MCLCMSRMPYRLYQWPYPAAFSMSVPCLVLRPGTWLHCIAGSFYRRGLVPWVPLHSSFWWRVIHSFRHSPIFFTLIGHAISFCTLHSYAINQFYSVRLTRVVIYVALYANMLITVAVFSKAWTVFALWSAGIVGSNPTQSMDVCVRLFCVCVVLCTDSGLKTSWSPVHLVLPSVYKIKKVKNDQGPTKEKL